MRIQHLIPYTLVCSLWLCLSFAGCGSPESSPVSETEATADVTPVEDPPEIEMPDPAPAMAPPASVTPAVAVDTTAEDWLIVPGERVGKITATSTEADLIAAYGAENVGDAEFYLGEGEMEMGTGLFSGDESKALRILWEDPATKVRPVSIQLTGAKSTWKTVEGISLGTPLTKVQELNGKPFKLFGFEWDYGGTLSEGNNGNIKGLAHEDLEKGFQPAYLSLTFQPDFEGKPDFPQEQYAQVAGDSEFSSDNPVMQELDPVVYSIHVSFPGATE